MIFQAKFAILISEIINFIPMPVQENRSNLYRPDTLVNMDSETREKFIADWINNFNDTRLYHKRGYSEY